MYTARSLLDLHERTHRSLQGLIDHCAGFSQDELSRELDGFGAGPIRMQLHHMIGAEEYWFGVLRGLMLTEDRQEDFASIDALRAYRERVVSTSRAYLDETSDEVLNRPAKMLTWGDKEVDLVPAHVVMRTQSHIFQHQGQIAAMARLLGRPVPRGLDFPLGPASG